MTQRTEKEETEFKVVPETLMPCVNDCGTTSNPATDNIFQKCFSVTTATSSSSTATGAPFAADVKISRSKRYRSQDNRSDSARSATDATKKTTTLSGPLAASNRSRYNYEEKKSVTRCSGCRKRVGLTGFRCRCGELFCSDHRYSDRHYCSYDYKAAGREAIARENPMVKAAKIVRV